MAAASEVPTMVSVLLPHASTSVRSARRRIADDLSRRGVPRTVVEDCMLVVSEILSNALKHARPLRAGHVEVAWDVQGDAINIQVADGGGPTQPRVHAPSLSALGGRGLNIVSMIAATWGVRENNDGTVVWATLPFKGETGSNHRRERRGD
jgi:anti-sigma regulatory factor (Ser/Thr protein kinase)